MAAGVSQPITFHFLFGPRRNPLFTKWDTIFEVNPKEWIAFRPALNLNVYPCYSCRHMFSSRKSYLDHVNRRAVVLIYKCPSCISTPSLTFYNRCAFLLHARTHFTMQSGEINLNDLEVRSLPIGLAGFTRIPDIPYIFDVDTVEYAQEGEYINAQFYAPKISDRGNAIIILTPSDLVINKNGDDNETQSLALKQVGINIPICKFITLTAQKALHQNHILNELVKSEPLEEPVVDEGTPNIPGVTEDEEPTADDEEDQVSSSNSTESASTPPQEMTLPVITKIESVAPDDDISRCEECYQQLDDVPQKHFMGDNKPKFQNFKCDECKRVMSTGCAFTAHKRLHQKLPPYICPECGRSFPNYDDLNTHMDDTCFHWSKNVRVKCIANKCGKLFAMPATYGQHFITHMQKMYECGLCEIVFFKLENVQKHAEINHPNDSCVVERKYQCSVCKEAETMNEEEHKIHISWHSNDKEQCIYVYTCQQCKSYFRTTVTYSTHLFRCSGAYANKNKKPRNVDVFASSKYISGECMVCHNKIIYTRDKKIKVCAKCKQAKVPTDKCCCILCKKIISLDDRKTHHKFCKYARPHVFVSRIDDSTTVNISSDPSTYEVKGGNNKPSTSPESKKRNSRSDDESSAVKRKRSRSAKPKRQEMAHDLTAEQPMQFDGTYQCKLCYIRDTDRVSFHQHIRQHRDSLTTYQCMECGECFVVKPSLVKHMLHYHNIKDFEKYSEENDCFDKSAVKELSKVVKLAPYVATEDAKENQCKVCLQEFNLKDELEKHFRSHGMAFLVRNSL